MLVRLREFFGSVTRIYSSTVAPRIDFKILFLDQLPPERGVAKLLVPFPPRSPRPR